MNTRLKQFLAAENISQSQFADTIKVVRASVSHVLSGRNNPSYDFIKSIMQAYPTLNVEWLMLGKGKMYKEAQQEHLEPELFADEIFPIKSPESDSRPVLEYTGTNELPINEPPQIITSNKGVQGFVNQRKAIKVTIFFDDGTYQDM